MHQAGTDLRYSGLFLAVRGLRRPTAEELDRTPADFPEVASVPALTELMVLIDLRWEHLGQVRKAGWKVPPDHPDIVPAHEALQLAEHYREAGRLPEVKQRAEEFRSWLRDGEAAARELEAALRIETERSAAETAFRHSGEFCSRCHARYRDVQQRP